MKDKIITVIKGHKLWAAFLLAALIKQLLVTGLPIWVQYGTPCDDELMKDWAFSMASFGWLGEFGAYTFMKEPGFSFFMAVCYRLHIPYIFIVTLGYSIACMFFCSALKKIISSKSIFIMYIILLFNPVSFCCSVLQRVYRSGFAMVLTLLVFGGLLHMYFSLCEEKIRPLLLWSFLTGLSLGYLWITKRDTIWILPFAGTICAVMFGILLVKKRNVRSIPRYICLAVPFLGIFLFSGAVKLCNIHWYGYPSLEYYRDVVYDICHIRSGQADDKISLSRKQLLQLYEICPTLASVRNELEEAMDRYSHYDTRREDGEVENGLLEWALSEGISNAGVYETCEKANTFYKNLYEELETAFDDGILVREESGITQKYYVDTAEHRKELIWNVGKVINHMNTYKRAYTRGFARNEWKEINEGFELLTGNSAARVRIKYNHDYLVTGWIVFSQDDMDSLKMYLEDQSGNQYAEVPFLESKGVYPYVAGTEYDIESAGRCGFKAEWNAEDGREDARWCLNVYKDGKSLVKIPVEQERLLEDEEIHYKGAVNNFVCREERAFGDANTRGVVRRLNFIGNIYRAFGQPLFYLGLVSYVVLTGLTAMGLRRKEFTHVNAWLTATGLGLSLIVFAAGIASVELTQCPVIKQIYLSSAYSALIGAELISVCKCGELVMSLVQKRGEKFQKDEKRTLCNL